MWGNSTTGRRWRHASRTVAAVAAVAAGTIGLLAASTAAVGGTAVAAGAAPPVASPSWHIVTQVKGTSFTAVVATGRAAGWAFTATNPPAAYQLTGNGWKRAAFPGKSRETVIAAAATSPASVWAFTDIAGSGSRVLRWNGHAWSVVKTFSRHIGGAAVVSDRAVWVFGEPYVPGNGLGAWYYNGHTWTQYARNLLGGSALSARDVWAFSGTYVYHWNGRTWAATNLARLLPPRQPLNSPSVTGVIALSRDGVYAIGNGNRQDQGGPTVVLRYDGRAWRKVAQGSFGFGAGQQIAADGRGGLWLPMPGTAGAPSYLAHYAAGQLFTVRLPVAAPYITIGSVARIPGTTQQLAGGLTHAKGDPSRNVVAVILRYS
jgi:hypothetical protein